MPTVRREYLENWEKVMGALDITKQAGTYLYQGRDSHNARGVTVFLFSCGSASPSLALRTYVRTHVRTSNEATHAQSGSSAPSRARMPNDMMSVRRGRQELQAGVERLEKLWDNMVDKHLS